MVCARSKNYDAEQRGIISTRNAARTPWQSRLVLRAIVGPALIREDIGRALRRNAKLALVCLGRALTIVFFFQMWWRLPKHVEPILLPVVSRYVMVTAPTLVIWGEKDTFVLTQNLDGLDQFVPQLTIKRIPDGSHWVIHEKWDEVNAKIRAFLH